MTSLRFGLGLACSLTALTLHTISYGATLADAAAEAGAVTTSAGLVFRMLREGSGSYPGPEALVRLKYRGILEDGRAFDTAEQPIDLPLDRVVKCMADAILATKIGGVARVTCPASMAYGRSGIPGRVPGNAVVQYDIELISASVQTGMTKARERQLVAEMEAADARRAERRATAQAAAQAISDVAAAVSQPQPAAAEMGATSNSQSRSAIAAQGQTTAGRESAGTTSPTSSGSSKVWWGVQTNCARYTALPKDGNRNWFSYTNDCGSAISVHFRANGSGFFAMSLKPSQTDKSWFAGSVPNVQHIACAEKAPSGEDVHFDDKVINCFYFRRQ